jgi:hypothetical protein
MRASSRLRASGISTTGQQKRADGDGIKHHHQRPGRWKARRGTVPELTQILDIKLNAQVSLWLTHAGITLPDVDGRRARAMSR